MDLEFFCIVEGMLGPMRLSWPGRKLNLPDRVWLKLNDQKGY
jgi:hypothetical protein